MTAFIFVFLMFLFLSGFTLAWWVRGGVPVGITVPLISFVVSSLFIPVLGYFLGVRPEPTSNALLIFLMWSLGFFFAALVPYIVLSMRIHSMKLLYKSGVIYGGSASYPLFFVALLPIIIAALALGELCSSVHEMPFSRGLYEATRSGFGHIFFSVLFLSSLAFVLSSWIPASKIKFVLQLVSVLLVVALGSKAPGITLVTIGVFHQIIIWHDSLLKTLFMFFGVLIIFLLALYIAHGGNGDANPAYNIAAYFDYTDNFFQLVVSGHIGGFGMYSIESELMSLLPRIVFPEKPELFGLVRLAADVFPARRVDAGAASFGPFGVWYADFGMMGLIPMMVMTAFVSAFAAIIENRFRIMVVTGNGLPWFTPLLMFLSGLPMVSVGQGFLPGLMLAMLLSITILLIGLLCGRIKMQFMKSIS